MLQLLHGYKTHLPHSFPWQAEPVFIICSDYYKISSFVNYIPLLKWSWSLYINREVSAYYALTIFIINLVDADMLAPRYICYRPKWYQVGTWDCWGSDSFVIRRTLSISNPYLVQRNLPQIVIIQLSFNISRLKKHFWISSFSSNTHPSIYSLN